MSITTKIMDEYRDKIIDPRPDLTKDSAQWQNFLILAYMKYGKSDPLFFENLRGLRSCGTLIGDNGKGGYKLMPLVDDKRGFYPGEYEAIRDKYFDRERKIRVGELLLMLQKKERLAE
jgi:hypothetical protein